MTLPEIRGEIELQDVSFSYVEGEDVIVHGQGEAHEVPAVGLLGTAVEHQDEGLAGFAPFQVVEVHSVDLRLPVFRFVFHGKGDTLLPRRLVQGQTKGMRSHFVPPVGGQ